MNEHLYLTCSGLPSKNPIINTGPSYSDGSRHHAAANKEYFTATSTTAWQCGAADFEMARWIMLDTVSSQDLINKGTEYSLEILTNKFRFGTYAGGSWTYVTANTFGVISTATWYFVRAWRDNTAGTINISVNNGTADSASATAPTAGSIGVVVGNGLAGFFNGRWDSAYMTKRLSTAGELTITYNGGSGQTKAGMVTANASRIADIDIWHDGNEETGTAYDQIGTNHLTATADPITAPPVYGSELIVNGGFETAGGGGSDVFGSWTENFTDGTVANETTVVHSDSHSAKITAGAAQTTTIRQDFAVTTGASYYYSFWSAGDGTNVGRYYVYDRTNAASIVTTAYTYNPTTTYKLVTGQFTAPAGCVLASIYFSPPNVTGGIAYFDDVSVKQITTASINNGGFDLRPATGGEKTNVSTVSRARTSNVATMVATAHGLKNGDIVSITGMTDTSFNGTNKVVTVVDVDTFTYASTGSDAGSAADTGGRIATDVFSSWEEVTAGASMIVAGTASPYAGTYNVRLDIDASTSTAGVRQTVIIAGKRYSYTLYAKGTDNTVAIAAGDNTDATQQTTHTLTSSYALYSGSFIATQTLFLIKRNVAVSKSIFIDNITLTSLGPTSDAGIASGLSANGYNVSKLLNQSSTGGQFVQVTISKQPDYSTTYLNGCLLFDGVDDGLLKTGDSIGTGDVTICKVFRATGLGASNTGRLISNSKFMVHMSSGPILSVSSDGTTLVSSGSISLNTSYVVMITRTSAGGVNIYINGVLSGTANQNSGTPVAGSDTYIGNRATYDRAFAGYLGITGVIQRCLGMGELQRLSRWLSVMSGGIY